MKNKQRTMCLGFGFTLLELIVAIALMDVIAVTLYSCMHTAFKSKANIETTLSPYRKVMPVFEHIRKDLVSAMQPDGVLAGVFEGEDASYIDGQDADTLSFYSACYHPDEDEIAGNIAYIQYELDEDHDRDQVVLKRLVTTNILAPSTEDPEEEVLARDIAGLDIEYYDGSSWVDEWDSSEEDSTLPWGVRVTISILDENRGRYSEEDLYRDFSRIYILPFANQETEDEETTD